MREPNDSCPLLNRAARCIFPSYDSQALECTATLPLILSLTHLVYLIATSPRTRERLIRDGNLDRLVRMLSLKQRRMDENSLRKWNLAFHCVIQLATVGGNEQIRTRIAQSDMVPIVLDMLQEFLHQRNHQKSLEQESPSFTATARLPRSDLSSSADGSVNEPLSVDRSLANAMARSHALVMSNRNPDDDDVKVTRLLSRQSSSQHHGSERGVVRRSTFPYVKLDAAQRRRGRRIRNMQPASAPHALFTHTAPFREEDVLLALHMLAYLSKYAPVREEFYTKHSYNVFAVVESFCSRKYPAAIQHWAAVIMRNACRKNEAQGGIRRCANTRCNKLEQRSHEFSKCRRCRRARYCSSECLTQSWANGHQVWCVERQATLPNANAHDRSAASALQNGQPVPPPNAVIPTHRAPTNMVRAGPPLTQGPAQLFVFPAPGSHTLVVASTPSPTASSATVSGHDHSSHSLPTTRRPSSSPSSGNLDDHLATHLANDLPLLESGNGHNSRLL